jgi:hypothetical protein
MPARRPPRRDPVWSDDEAPTARANETLAVYQSLLSVFDPLGQRQRLRFVDLARVFGELSDEGQERLLEMAEFLKGR